MNEKNEAQRIPVIAVVGPTASGKTALGVALCRRFDGEVVSADSMQIYRGMEIAAAVPTMEERQGVAHHLMQFLDPTERYSVAAYCKDAAVCIADIHARGKLPVVVGGTGLYINALLDHVTFAETDTDLSIRQTLTERLERNGIAPLLEELRQVDPIRAAQLHENDAKRILRALEFYYQNGFTITEQDRLSRTEPSPYRVLTLGLFVKDRAVLYDRINRRVDQMAANGLLEEAKRCLNDPRATAAQAIGHKELKRFFDGEATEQEALDHLKQQTRRYAKRQLTWFGRDERIVRLYIDEYDDFSALVQQAFAYCEPFLKGEEEHE